MLLPPSLTINSVATFHAELLSRTMPANDGDGTAMNLFVLDAAKVESITTPGMQLLLSLDKSLDLQGRTLSVVNPTDAFMQAFLDLGMDDYLVKWSK